MGQPKRDGLSCSSLPSATVAGMVQTKRGSRGLRGSLAEHRPYVAPSEEEQHRRALVVLRGARRLVARGWCRGAQCADASGDSSFTMGAPVAWSLYGAIATAGAASIDCEYARRLVRKRIDTHIPQWNDHPMRTQRDVLYLLDSLCEYKATRGWTVTHGPVSR